MFYAIYMATRARARACIFHKTLGLMLYLLRTWLTVITGTPHDIFCINMKTLSPDDLT